jgi:quaternary ammonium compound-resistance protein SugE
LSPAGEAAAAWISLAIAGVLEIVWAISMKYSAGFSRLWASMLTVGAALASFYFLSRALHSLPVGTAYAIWTGIGAVGTALLGMILFGEPRSALRLLCMALIVAGMVGLRFAK